MEATLDDGVVVDAQGCTVLLRRRSSSGWLLLGRRGVGGVLLDIAPASR